jgi:hypothetical protein
MTWNGAGGWVIFSHARQLNFLAYRLDGTVNLSGRVSRIQPTGKVH